LATAIAILKEDAKEEAARKALIRLDREFHIVEIPPDPYSRPESTAVAGDRTITPEFRNAIQEILVRCKIRYSVIESIISSNDKMQNFLSAFTHPSVDREFNYLLYNFLGNAVLDESIVFYLKYRFPRIQSVKWLTKIKHSITNRKLLASLVTMGANSPDKLPPRSIAKFIRYDAEFAEEIKDGGLKYVSFVENIMKALLGSIILTIEQYPYPQPHGVGVQIAFYLIQSYFDSINISVKYENVFDAVSRLKELYESKGRGFKWPNKDAYQIVRPEEGPDAGKYQVTVFAWPKGDRRPYDQNKVALVTVTAQSKDEAKQEAAMKALNILKHAYKIGEIPPDPYQTN